MLAGKNLSHETLTPLTTAILGVIDSAFACRLDSSDLAQSASFRASIEQAYNALIALDVSTANTQAVMRLLYQAARPVAISPLLPPLYRPNR